MAKSKYVTLLLLALMIVLMMTIAFNLSYAQPPYTLIPNSDAHIYILSNPYTGSFYDHVNGENPSYFLVGTGGGAYAVFGTPGISDIGITITDVTVYAVAQTSNGATFQILLYTDGQGDFNNPSSAIGSGILGGDIFPQFPLTYHHTWTTNPLTGSAWTLADINSLFAGIFVLSTPGGYVIEFYQLYIVVNGVSAPSTYSLTVSSGSGGSTSPTPGSYSEVSGSSVQLTAMPDLGYDFTYWLLDGNNVGNTNPIMVAMDGDHSLQAEFSRTLSSPSTYASASTVDQGQTSTLTITGLSGGAMPYSYQWLWSVPGAGIYSSISGATSVTFPFLTSPSTTPGNYSFELRVTDNLGEQATSSATLVQVNVSPTVAVLPTSIAMNNGQSKTFTAFASGGTGTLSYQWYLNGSVVSGATDATWAFSPSATGSPSIYVKIIDQASFPIAVQSNTPIIIVNSPLVAPTLSASPSTVDQAQPSNLSSTAESSGTSPYSYQWIAKAPSAGAYSAISGATSSSYSFVTSGSTAPGSWSFELQVTDTASAVVTSNSVSITVNVAPTVSVSPASWTMEVGQFKMFTATPAGGSGTYTHYQWYVDSVLQNGQTASTFSYSSASSGSHSISVTVTDSLGVTSPQSTEVAFTINSALAAPGVHASPGTVDQGQSSSLTTDLISTGIAPYSYQWLEEAPGSTSYFSISGANSATYILSTSTSTAAGAYSFELRVTDGLGTVVTSSAVAILVDSLPSVSISPTIAALDIGQSTTFSSTPTGSTSLFSYQWYQNGTAVTGATSATFTYTPTSTGTAAIFVRVTDNYGEVAASDSASVTIYAQLVAPSVNASSTAINHSMSTVNQGQQFTLASTEVSSGAPPYSFQWFAKAPNVDSYSPIAEATSSTSDFDTTTSTMVGTWKFLLQVTDSAGATINATEIPVIVNSVASTSLSANNKSVWVPPVLNAGAAAGFAAIAVGILSLIFTYLSNPLGGMGGKVGQKTKDLIPDNIKKWLEDFVASKRKLQVETKSGPTFLPTKPEIVVYGISIIVLTLAFSYVKVINFTQIIQVLPIVLVTSILVGFVKKYFSISFLRSRGIWCEHKLWIFGLGLFLFTTFVLRVPFSSPSRSIHCPDKFSKRLGALASSAEILIGLLFGGFFFLLLIGGFPVIGSTGLAMCIIGSFCDTFPVEPLSGREIFDHSKILWAILFVITLSLYALWLLLL